MYHILESRKLTESLNSLPTVREIHFDDVIEIRRIREPMCVNY